MQHNKLKSKMVPPSIISLRPDQKDLAAVLKRTMVHGTLVATSLVTLQRMNLQAHRHPHRHDTLHLHETNDKMVKMVLRPVYWVHLPRVRVDHQVLVLSHLLLRVQDHLLRVSQVHLVMALRQATLCK